MSRKFRVAAAALFLGATLISPITGSSGSIASAATPDDPATDSALKATNAGTISGSVTKVDFQKNRVSLMTMHGGVDFTVLPSTTFQGRSFSEISDLAKGQKLTVFLSQKGDEKFAQIIRLTP